MDENDQADDFDDFFDTPGRSLHHSTEQDVKSDQARASKLSPDRSAKKRGRNGSGSVDRSSMSSDRDASPDYSSDSVSESDSDSRSRKRRKSKSRSQSASSRSGGSYSSDSSTSFSSDNTRTRSSTKKGGRHSRSRSSSSDRSRSRSRTGTPDSRGYKGKSKSKRRDSYSSVTSSSTHSESKDSRKRTPSPRSKEAARRQAWGIDEKSSNSRQDRPKTAKQRLAEERPRGDASRRRGHNDKHSVADSDSDMTDVSPILSPRNGSVNGHGKDVKDKYRAFKPVYQAVEDSGRNITDGGDSTALDLNILMKAVSELEKQKRVKANTRRVMFEPLRARPMDKSNYTFSNDDTHRIDEENKRLLQQIVRQMHTTKERHPRATDLRIKQATLTASAVNRRREQQRIENENLAFLKRLQNIRPSRGISRNEQLSSYNSTVLHGIPIATLHPTKKSHRSGRESSASSVMSSLGRTRSLSSIHSAATASSIGTNASRQSSRAGSRPSSAKKSVREKPPWNDRW